MEREQLRQFDPNNLDKERRDSPLLEQFSNEKLTHEQRGVKQLGSLLCNPLFHERYITVHTASIQQRLIGLESELKKPLKARVRYLLQQEALQQLGLTGIEQAKQQPEEWQRTTSTVKEITVYSVYGIAERVPLSDARSILIERRKEELLPKITVAQEELIEEREKRKLVLENLQEEFERRKHDPKLYEAMRAWGRTPDSLGNTGASGRGYHSGVIHYFEYRGNSEKVWRFDHDMYPFGIEGFIKTSLELGRLLAYPYPIYNGDVADSITMADERGNKRLILLTKRRSVVIGFQHGADREPMRVITVLERFGRKKFNGIVEEELQGKKKSTINQLEGERWIEII